MNPLKKQTTTAVGKKRKKLDEHPNPCNVVNIVFRTNDFYNQIHQSSLSHKLLFLEQRFVIGPFISNHIVFSALLFHCCFKKNDYIMILSFNYLK